MLGRALNFFELGVFNLIQARRTSRASGLNMLGHGQKQVEKAQKVV
jgi:hypothetical protein